MENIDLEVSVDELHTLYFCVMSTYSSLRDRFEFLEPIVNPESDESRDRELMEELDHISYILENAETLRTKISKKILKWNEDKKRPIEKPGWGKTP